MKPVDETWLILLSVVLPFFCSLNHYTSILFVLFKCRNFFSVAHFGAAVLVFSACFGVAFFCFNFAFCSTTYVRPLSHLSLLGFVTFVFFTCRCHLFFILRCQLFPFINLCAFSYYLSFLLPDAASGRSAVNCTVCCSTLVLLFKLLYASTFRPTSMPELLLCCALRCSHSRPFCALRCCFLLLQLCLLFDYLCSSDFSPFSTVFCHFCIFHTSLSPIFHTSLSHIFLHKLMRFLILSFISLT